MSRISNLLCMCVVAGLVAARAEATVFTVGSHVNDGSTLNGSSSFEVTSSNGRILAGSGGSGQFTGIYYFPLPVIPSGQFLASSNIGLTVTNDLTGATALPVDLYGLGYLTSAPTTTINNAYHYVGTNDTRTGTTLSTNIGSTPITKIANDFLIGGNSLAAGTLIETTAGQDVVLTNFLQSLFDQGAAAGNFAVFRVNADFAPSTSTATRFEFGSQNNSTASFRPFLQFDIQEVPPPPAPEPSTLGMLALGILGLRRRSATRKLHSVK